MEDLTNDFTAVIDTLVNLQLDTVSDSDSFRDISAAVKILQADYPKNFKTCYESVW
jgi:hypothetical protein